MKKDSYTHTELIVLKPENPLFDLYFLSIIPKRLDDYSINYQNLLVEIRNLWFNFIDMHILYTSCCPWIKKMSFLFPFFCPLYLYSLDNNHWISNTTLAFKFCLETKCLWMTSTTTSLYPWYHYTPAKLCTHIRIILI